MDQREHQLQSLNICHRLFNFIMKSIASQALKTVNLGPPPMNRGLSQVHISCAAQDGAGSNSDNQMAAGRPSEAALSGAEVELEQGNASKTLEPFGPHGGELPPVQDNDSHMNSGKRPEEEATLSTAAPQPKAPKKMVSINDVVEEISTTKKNKKMNKATKKLTSLEREGDDPKPLRSILKVGSKLNEKSDSSVNPRSDG